MFQTFYRGSELLTYPLVGFGIFFACFLGTFAWAYWPRRRDAFADRAALPLSEDNHVDE
jgi:cbb3-type cytochrome oxidase subunit 3